MKHLNVMAAGGLALSLVGCASNTKLAVMEPVGPCPMSGPNADRLSALKVYSARQLAPTDLNRDTFCDADAANADTRFESAFQDYSIYAADGSLVQRVRNSRGTYDTAPAVVSLSPGYYTIETAAELPGGETTLVKVPVVIKPQKTTTVHLEPNWQASPTANLATLLRASDGRVVGCRAEGPIAKN